jgi:hypothetical protein
MTDDAARLRALERLVEKLAKRVGTLEAHIRDDRLCVFHRAATEDWKRPRD